MAKRLDVDLVDEFANFLRGEEVPGGISLSKRPRKMTAAQAMAVIYVLQQFVHCIPDCFEMCKECARIFDTEYGGHISAEGEFWCDFCSRLCRCSECTEAVNG